MRSARRSWQFFRTATQTKDSNSSAIPLAFRCGVGYLHASFGGCIAQLVEQLTLNQRVLGSSPSTPTKDFKDLADWNGSIFLHSGGRFIFRKVHSVKRVAKLFSRKSR